MHPNVAALLAHGGWEVADPAELRSPDGQPLQPASADDLARLEPGHGVRVVLGLATLSDGAIAPEPPYGTDGVPNLIGVAEQTWLFVVGNHGETLTALLANPVQATHTRLAPNSLITVPADRVLEVRFDGAGDVEEFRRRITAAGFAPQTVEEAAAPVEASAAPRLDPDQTAALATLGVRPHPVHPTSLVVMERHPDTSLPLVGRRDEPDHTHRDSGWVIQSARPDPGDDPDRFGALEAGGLQSFGPVWAHLALPPGWGFVLRPGGTIQVISPEDAAAAAAAAAAEAGEASEGE